MPIIAKLDVVRRSLILVLATSLLGGCSLTRVSDDAFAEEVKTLNVTGMSLTDAVAKVNREGFECRAENARTAKVSLTPSSSRFLKQLECSKQNNELFCPQIRNVVLNADPKTDTVILVGKTITQRACF
ncbi:hypothetical protein [Kluyvera genomosp. 1]|uniref:hypothetical protein n=1 Tax=Kluyvera genomosp. 1 TaxID=2774053 RepID=UPI000691233B|nr:hypothetical protein [Kluyvera genomosp. 1]